MFGVSSGVGLFMKQWVEKYDKGTVLPVQDKMSSGKTIKNLYDTVRAPIPLWRLND